MSPIQIQVGQNNGQNHFSVQWNRAPGKEMTQNWPECHDSCISCIQSINISHNSTIPVVSFCNNSTHLIIKQTLLSQFKTWQIWPCNKENVKDLLWPYIKHYFLTLRPWLSFKDRGHVTQSHPSSNKKEVVKFQRMLVREKGRMTNNVVSLSNFSSRISEHCQFLANHGGWQHYSYNSVFKCPLFVYEIMLVAFQ